MQVSAPWKTDYYQKLFLANLENRVAGKQLFFADQNLRPLFTLAAECFDKIKIVVSPVTFFEDDFVLKQQYEKLTVEQRREVESRLPEWAPLLEYSRMRELGQLHSGFLGKKRGGDRDKVEEFYQNLFRQSFAALLRKKPLPIAEAAAREEFLRIWSRALDLARGEKTRASGENGVPYWRQLQEEGFLAQMAEQILAASQDKGPKDVLYEQRFGVAMPGYPLRPLACPGSPSFLHEEEAGAVKNRDYYYLCSADFPPEMGENLAEWRIFNPGELPSWQKNSVDVFCQSNPCPRYYNPVLVDEERSSGAKSPGTNSSKVKSFLPSLIDDKKYGLESLLELYAIYNKYYFAREISLLYLTEKYKNIADVVLSQEEGYVKIVNTWEGPGGELSQKVSFGRDHERQAEAAGKSSKQFAFVPFSYLAPRESSSSIEITDDDHAGLVFVDKRLKTMEVYAPHGDEFLSERYSDGIRSLFAFLLPYFPGYAQAETKMCPRVNLQGLSLRDDRFCVMWTSFFLENYLTFRQKGDFLPPGEFQLALRDSLLRQSGKEGAAYFFRTVVSYTCYMLEESFRFLEERGELGENARAAWEDFRSNSLYSAYTSQRG